MLWLGIAGWLWQEQKQQQRRDEESQRTQGRVLIQTVASCIRSQSGMAMYRPERLQAILDYVAANPGVLALALFDADGKTIAAAGKVEKLARAPAEGTLENWTAQTLQLWSAVQIGEIPWNSRLGPAPPRGGPGRGPNAFRLPRRGVGGRGRGPAGPPPVPPSSKFFLTVLLPADTLQASYTAGARLRLLVAGMAFLFLAALALAWRTSARGVALRSSLALAEEQNRHLREMNLAASGLAHETKNPLNVVRMAGQTLAKMPASSPEWKERVKLIVDEVDRLDARINEWLAFSRPREPKPGRVELDSLFEELQTLISLDAEEKDAALHLEQNGSTVWADREMLRQILFNFLLNGVQALDKGGELRAEVRSGKDANVSIVIEDDGVGVAPEYRDRLFTPYFTTRQGGSGLGLAICRRLAHAHGWQVRYQPRSPRGSAFILEGVSLAGEKE
jgi:signal transduction histidine kinase